MPKIPDELKPALGRFITPAALFWFRWGAMGTIFFGIVPGARAINYLIEAYTLDLSEGTAGWPLVPKYLAIGIGMWLGTIMWFNVWFVIWPNQQKALNIGGKYPDLAAPPTRPPRARPPACSAASTRCCPSPCCSAWWRRGIFTEIASALSVRGTARATRAVLFLNGRRFSQPPGRLGARRRSRPLFRRPVRAGAACGRFFSRFMPSMPKWRGWPRRVREPMLGAIRLEWWRETAEGAAKGAPRNHDVARGLAALFAERALSRWQTSKP